MKDISNYDQHNYDFESYDEKRRRLEPYVVKECICFGCVRLSHCKQVSLRRISCSFKRQRVNFNDKAV